MTERILIVDPDDALREGLSLMLADEPVEVLSESSAQAALDCLEVTRVDILLCEMAVPGLDDLDLLPQIRQRSPNVPIVLMSDGGREELASAALSRGAHDCIGKPFALEELKLALRRVRERAGLRLSNQLLQRDIVRAVGERPIVAASPSMIDVLEQMERAASYKTPALLTGENGTGKELLARAIHAQSPRRAGPFSAFDCRGATQELLESQLFGRAGVAKGSRFGALGPLDGLLVEAKGGSLYLDEVGELPKALQQALLRVLQDEEVHPVGESKSQPVDVRIIAASSGDLSSNAESGHFDTELFSRLNAMHLSVPALRERRQDIPLLVDHFMARMRVTLGKPALRMADNALERLSDYPWPGNIRELANVVERAMILADGDRISLRQLPADVVAGGHGDSDRASQDFSLKGTRRVAEADVIERALSATKGNRTHAAKLLGISHRALLYKIKDYQIRN